MTAARIFMPQSLSEGRAQRQGVAATAEAAAAPNDGQCREETRMPQPTPEIPRVVAILNSNDDLVRLVREALHSEGYLTIQHHIADLRDGHTDISHFLADRNPPVIIYDLAPPFTLNWQFLGLLRKHPGMADRTLILTTDNAAALREVIGVEALQIVGQDSDLRQLVTAVNAAFKTMKPRAPEGTTKRRK
jgi:DNA-binding NarL/FixJ family response regulator